MKKRNEENNNGWKGRTEAPRGMIARRHGEMKLDGSRTNKKRNVNVLTEESVETSTDSKGGGKTKQQGQKARALRTRRASTEATSARMRHK